MKARTVYFPCGLIVEMAKYVSELTKMGMQYYVEYRDGGWYIEITGF